VNLRKAEGTGRGKLEVWSWRCALVHSGHRLTARRGRSDFGVNVKVVRGYWELHPVDLSIASKKDGDTLL
jgi:hypothetical protein